MYKHIFSYFLGNKKYHEIYILHKDQWQYTKKNDLPFVVSIMFQLSNTSNI